MSRCVICKSQIPDGAAYCPKCGAHAVDPSLAEAPAPSQEEVDRTISAVGATPEEVDRILDAVGTSPEYIGIDDSIDFGSDWTVYIEPGQAEPLESSYTQYAPYAEGQPAFYENGEPHYTVQHPAPPIPQQKHHHRGAIIAAVVVVVVAAAAAVALHFLGFF